VVGGGEEDKKLSKETLAERIRNCPPLFGGNTFPAALWKTGQTVGPVVLGQGKDNEVTPHGNFGALV